MKIKPVICWRSRLTGQDGKGEPLDIGIQEAKNIMHEMNEQYPALRHWVASRRVEEEPAKEKQ